MKRHYYRARLVKDGPLVGVQTFLGPPVVDGEVLDRSPRWQCLVGDELTGRVVFMGEQLPIDVEGVTLRNVESIEPEQYHYMLAHAQWAVKHAPSMPDAAPRQKIDLKRMRSIF